ncbi:hypothetical protein [Acinetobacter bereziniae]|uniref:hypothetical protein n=1 Tax=Acinetobacter bereziniae TaxID=106648 RepID=UPI0019008FE6|nr:hypothetical protein [Acinetobacter bereziniae]MBJ8552720.1 hypothetical protein [Acinetobacter bereziniae]
MEISKRKKLLIAIEILVVRPGKATELTISDALVGFKDLIEDITNGELIVTYEPKEPQQ